MEEPSECDHCDLCLYSNPHLRFYSNALRANMGYYILLPRDYLLKKINGYQRWEAHASHTKATGPKSLTSFASPGRAAMATAQFDVSITTLKFLSGRIVESRRVWIRLTTDWRSS